MAETTCVVQQVSIPHFQKQQDIIFKKNKFYFPRVIICGIDATLVTIKIFHCSTKKVVAEHKLSATKLGFNVYEIECIWLQFNNALNDICKGRITLASHEFRLVLRVGRTICYRQNFGFKGLRTIIRDHVKQRTSTSSSYNP